MRATPTGSASGTWKAVNSSGSTSNTGSFTGTNVNKMNKKVLVLMDGQVLIIFLEVMLLS